MSTEAILQSLLPAESLEALSKGELTPEQALQNIENSYRQKFEPEIINSAKEKLQSELTGKHLGELRSNAAKILGVSKSELEGKNTSDIFALIKEAKASSSTSEEDKKRIQALEVELQKRNDLASQIEGEYKSKIDELNNSFESYKYQQKYDNLLYNVTSDVPLIPGVSQVALKATIKAELESKGLQISFDETGTPVLINKATGTQAYKPNTTHKLDIKEALVSFIAPFTAKAVPQTTNGLPTGGTGSQDDKPKSKLLGAWGNQ